MMHPELCRPLVSLLSLSSKGCDIATPDGRTEESQRSVGMHWQHRCIHARRRALEMELDMMRCDAAFPTPLSYSGRAAVIPSRHVGQSNHEMRGEGALSG